jgi:hypothetical protein
VKQRKPELDASIRSAITDCLTKIKAIGTGGRSFYEVVSDKKENGANSEDDARVNAAVEACAQLGTLLNSVADIID